MRPITKVGISKCVMYSNSEYRFGVYQFVTEPSKGVL